MLKCTFVGELLTPLLDIRTQWMVLSADIDKRSNAEADDGTFRRVGRLRRADRAK